MWLALIAGFFDLIAAKQKQKTAEIENKARLLGDRESNNSSWEMAALAADRLAWLRMFSFWLFTAPVLYTVYDPEQAEAVWLALETVPDWVIGVQMSITGFIWAAKPISNLGAAIIGKNKGLAG